ncbi:hypothetical protein BC628DRAFT_244829 [Trametes gibbosa]|nr:hypothetical protein BC628DRAFT_244829 [Trametes gibbosa]
MHTTSNATLCSPPSNSERDVSDSLTAVLRQTSLRVPRRVCASTSRIQSPYATFQVSCNHGFVAAPARYCCHPDTPRSAADPIPPRPSSYHRQSSSNCRKHSSWMRRSSMRERARPPTPPPRGPVPPAILRAGEGTSAHYRPYARASRYCTSFFHSHSPPLSLSDP